MIQPRVRFLLAAVALAALPRLAAAQSYHYIVTDLGTLSGPVSTPSALNAAGQVVGTGALVNSHFHAAAFGAGAVDLGVVGSDAESAAYGINDAGQIVGVSYSYGALTPHAVLWINGTPTPLPDFTPRDINASGMIVGCSSVYNAANLWVGRACSYLSGTLTELASLGGANSQAFAVNDGGVIVGQSFLVNDTTLRACAWINGTPHDLGTLAGGAAAQSSAADVNTAGQVVGWSDSVAGTPHAFLYQLDSAGNVVQRTDLGALGTTFSYAYGINSAGIVVGSSDSRAVAWTGGAAIDLNAEIPAASGWFLTRAVGVNDTGQIAAEGMRHGFAHALLLTPVACRKADMNADGAVDGSDVQVFVNVLLSGGTPAQVCAGDMAAVPDGRVTTADVQAFVTCVLSPALCP